MSKQVVLVTGDSSGFGAMSARELATTGHIAYAGIGLADLLKPVANARAKIAAGNRADETEQQRR